jgi:peptidylprolyl isomerase
MHSLMPLRFVFFVLTFAWLACAGFSGGPRGDFSAEDEEVIEREWPVYQETPSGLRYVVQRQGTGDKPLRGMKISVVYSGYLLDGSKFNENLDRENPFQFRLGGGEVILGWEEAFADMREGEKRILIIPYALGYGLRGNGEMVPRRSTLIFFVEVVDIEG